MAKAASGSYEQGYQQSETGTVTTIFMNSKAVGRATSATAQIEYGTTGVWGIGDYMPYEYVFMRYNGQLTVEGIRMRTNDMVSAGIIALGEDVLKQGDTLITIQDKYTHNLLASYSHCTPVSYNLQVRANQLVTEQAVFNFTSATQKK
ncbi:hypothetical protein [Levilactobacillus phage ENFP1]|nr:hypothetical protein [Levilactobacillus phage ENFP1]